MLTAEEETTLNEVIQMLEAQPLEYDFLSPQWFHLQLMIRFLLSVRSWQFSSVSYWKIKRSHRRAAHT